MKKASLFEAPHVTQYFQRIISTFAPGWFSEYWVVMLTQIIFFDAQNMYALILFFPKKGYFCDISSQKHFFYYFVDKSI